jgi:ceramide glucosyltransferase
MFHHAIRIAQLIAVLGTLSSLAYYLLCIWSARRFLRNQTAGSLPAPAQPPVSILKPLKGTDPEMYESFRSHCLQDYPQYEIIFGVSDPDDPAIEFVERLRQEFPAPAISLMVCPAILGANVKVSNLVQMVRQAKHDIVLVNDSDIRVPLNYLQKVMAALTEPGTGLVTCLYRGIASNTLGSRLEALGISTDFSAGVLAAQGLEGGVRFGLGSTLALRRSDLESIGGFEALVDYLADDYELGLRIAQKGLRVKLADIVVETFLPAYSLPAFFQHQLRWGRGIRNSRPWGYLGLVSTFGLPWSLLALVFTQGTTWAWTLFGAVLALRFLAALVVGRKVLRDNQVVRFLWLLPLRDLMAVLVWIASFLGSTVRWRGDVFRLKDGRLVRMKP